MPPDLFGGFDFAQKIKPVDAIVAAINVKIIRRASLITGSGDVLLFSPVYLQIALLI